MAQSKKRFADLFNGILFMGEQTIKAEELTEINSQSDIIISDKESKTKATQRYRDIIMQWEGINLVIHAFESQNNVSYAMPIRNMIYDSLSYSEQIHNRWNELNEEEKRRWLLMNYFQASEKMIDYIL